MELNKKLSELFLNETIRIIISNPRRKSLEYKRIEASRVAGKIQIAKYSTTQVFHENIEAVGAGNRLSELINNDYKQINAFTEDSEIIILVSKDGKYKVKEKRVNNESDSIQSITSKADNKNGNEAASNITSKADNKNGNEAADNITSKADSISDKTSNKVSKSNEKANPHNRRKQYIISESADCPALVDMGVLTKDGRVVASKYDKFRQINRFCELIDDEIKNWKREDINIIDFGCGKSYLTFVLYYYLTAIKGLKARILGLDLKAEVIKNCNIAAKKYGYEGLSFELGDINGYKASFKVDMVVTLHACDVATDYALVNAIDWGAKLIFSVPCCQHEVNKAMDLDSLSIMGRYGIIKERFAALATDACRANALEYMGYKTQVLEFVDMEHTPKNILIRAVKRDMVPKATRSRALQEIEALTKALGCEPSIIKLLGIANNAEYN